MASTLIEVVHGWNNIYYTKKKSHKGDGTKLYNEILDELATKYYQKFHYESKALFKADIRFVKSNLKKSHPKVLRKALPPKREEPVEESLFKEEQEEEINEGSGLLFTLKQIKDCDLLDDSYL